MDEVWKAKAAGIAEALRVNVKCQTLKPRHVVTALPASMFVVSWAHFFSFDSQAYFSPSVVHPHLHGACGSKKVEILVFPTLYKYFFATIDDSPSTTETAVSKKLLL